MIAAKADKKLRCLNDSRVHCRRKKTEHISAPCLVIRFDINQDRSVFATAGSDFTFGQFLFQS